MPPRTAPTARQQRLGSELRKLRERAGMTASEAGALLGADQARISNIESGRAGVSAQRLRALAQTYDCADRQLIDALTTLTGSRTRHWWEEYRGTLPPGLLDLAEIEHHAVALRTAQTSILPGLLQTSDHARVIFDQGVPPLPPDEVEHRVAHRLRRQGVLCRDTPMPYTAVIHEAALRMRFGGRDVTRAQLDHLVAMSERENVRVLAIPFERGEFPGAGQTILYASGPVAQLDTVQLDQSHGPALLDAADQLARYRALLDRMEELALDRARSRDFIRAIARAV
ncbi:helix-turn-helix transcriptional regulator [Streptomyces sp. NPDC050617]|uniref:helix-turn-helix domain-containing protein n=1 Tax=Streptomyces sp. NPDC050617 TaxID=3154628 RepID=UPI00341762AC